MDAFTSAWASLKAAADMLKIGVDARDDAKVKAATIELREKLFELSGVAMNYVSENAALTLEIAALKLTQAKELEAKTAAEDWRRERERYALHALASGVLAYAVKPGQEREGEPLHYACQPCLDKHVKSILQPQNRLLICPADTRHNIRTEHPGQAQYGPGVDPSTHDPFAGIPRQWGG